MLHLVLWKKVKFMNYNEAISFIKKTAKFGSNLGLERTEKILEIMGNPHKKIKCIHIAGTNGKGSTTAMISRVLFEAGYKVGMYISPFLEEFEERIQINGCNIKKEDLAEAVSRVSEAIDEALKLGYDHPTEFEIITCAMFYYFHKNEVNYAVVEVGLGGRLDSTNVITPVLSVITSISYDHMNILGDTLEKIAYEKSGIIKDGIPVICYPQEKESMEVIKSTCVKKKSKLIEVPRESVKLKKYLLNINDNTQRIEINTAITCYDIELSLLGKHQLLNCATAIYALEELRLLGCEIDKIHIMNALKDVTWPGRLEIMRKNPLIVIDGAHNIDGINKLKESVSTYFKYKDIILILGILADKEVEGMVRSIVPLSKKVITVTPHSDRAEIANALRLVVEKYKADTEAFDDYDNAFDRALDIADADDMILVCGSLYMIGDMRKVIRNKQNS